MICPNCQFKLVLLQPRSKYKCSLCSKLYPKKQIESKKFQKWNKQQRLLDIQNLTIKKPKIKLSEQEKKLKAKNYRLKNKQKLKEYEVKYISKNRELYNQKKRTYWNKNNNKVNLKRKERYNLKKQQIQTYQDSWRKNNQYNYEINKKLKDLREQQKQLTLQLCKKQTYKLYTKEIQKVLPTYLLSDLLLIA